MTGLFFQIVTIRLVALWFFIQAGVWLKVIVFASDYFSFNQLKLFKLIDILSFVCPVLVYAFSRRLVSIVYRTKFGSGTLDMHELLLTLITVLGLSLVVGSAPLAIATANLIQPDDPASGIKILTTLAFMLRVVSGVLIICYSQRLAQLVPFNDKTLRLSYEEVLSIALLVLGLYFCVTSVSSVVFSWGTTKMAAKLILFVIQLEIGIIILWRARKIIELVKPKL